MKNQIAVLKSDKKLKFLGISEKDYKGIADESEKLLKNLTDKEIEENQKELLNTLSPDLISFFRKNYYTPMESENDEKAVDNTKEIDYNDENNQPFLLNIYFNDQGEVTEKKENTLIENENNIENPSNNAVHNLTEIFNLISLPQKYNTLISYGLNKLLNILKLLKKKNKNSDEFLDCLLVSEKENKILRRKFTNLFLTENFNLIQVFSRLITRKVTTINVLTIKVLALFLTLRYSNQFTV